MRKTVMGAVAAGALVVGLAVSGVSTAQQAPAQPSGSVTKLAADNCARAHAVIFGTRNRDDGFFGAAIAGIMRVHPHWRLVAEPEVMISQSIAYKVWNVSPAGDQHTTTVYVGHCGHGATCNELARTVKRLFPMTSPEVYCGEVPGMLNNPENLSL